MYTSVKPKIQIDWLSELLNSSLPGHLLILYLKYLHFLDTSKYNLQVRLFLIQLIAVFSDLQTSAFALAYYNSFLPTFPFEKMKELVPN